MPTLAGFVLGLLVAPQWDGETRRNLYEIGFDRLLIILITTLGILLGMVVSRLLALHAVAPLGRFNKNRFSVLLCSQVLPLAGIFALISPAAFGLVRLVIMQLACAVSHRLDPSLTGFPVRTRIWSA